MKSFLKRFFKKEKPLNSVPSLPEWDEIVKIMYDKGLTSFVDEVVKVIYSYDKSMRYVILKDKNGFFSYALETVYAFDEDEWKYISQESDALPGMWVGYPGIKYSSLFENSDIALREIKAEPYYKKYF